MTEYEIIVVPTGVFSMCDDRSKKLGFGVPEIYVCKFKKCFYTPPTPPVKLAFYGARWVQRTTLPWYIGMSGMSSMSTCRIPFPNECCRPESAILLQTALKRASDKGNGKDSSPFFVIEITRVQFFKGLVPPEVMF